MTTSERWNIVQADPATGKVSSTFRASLTARQVVDSLRLATKFDPVELAKYAVGDADTLRRFTSAERWLEDHPVAHVVSAWTVGAPAAQRTRQEKLREWWPDLALALDNLEANHGSN